MKKYFVLLTACVLAISAAYARKVHIGNLYYNLDDKTQTAEVTYKQTDWDRIVSTATWDITKATIPYFVSYDSVIYSVTSIRHSTFSKCPQLSEVTIPNSVTSIGGSAFWGCSNLKEIEIPESVTDIGDNAFYGTGITKLVYNSSVFAFMPATFKGEFTVPEGIKSIVGGACYKCTDLTRITIPKSVTKINVNIFSGCSNLQAIIVAPDNPNYCSIDGVLFSKDTSILIAYPGGKKGDYIVPQQVSVIEKYAFSGCRGITRVTLPQTITNIGNNAFLDCSGLTYLTIPDSISRIEAYTFSGCSALTSIVIPKNTTHIGMNAFSYCANLKQVIIPDSTTTIGSNAFAKCIGLDTVTIGKGTFHIQPDAFASCMNLKAINVVLENSNYCSIDGVLFRKDTSALISYPCGKKGAYIIPNGVTKIFAEAFSRCTGLTSVTIPKSVTKILPNAFEYCTYLGSIEIPDGVSDIFDRAFSYCIKLNNIILGSSVKKFGRDVFTGCSSLKSITCRGQIPPVLDRNNLSLLNLAPVVYVPIEALNSYQSHKMWGQLDVRPIDPKDELTRNPSLINGLWNLCHVHDGQVVPSRSYYRLNPDGSAECFATNEGSYYYYKGTYRVNDRILHIELREYRQYMVQSDIARLITDVTDDPDCWFTYDFSIIAISEHEIKMADKEEQVYFIKASSLPNYWDYEYSEPNIVVSDSNLMGRWVCTSFIEAGSNRHLVLPEPEKYGMNIGEKGALTYCEFWLSTVYTKEQEAGLLSDDERIFVPYDDCSWASNGNELTMYCRTYTILKYDASGTIISETQASIKSPITETYTIHRLTDHWLVLYSNRTMLYYVFHRDAPIPSSSPRRKGVRFDVGF